MQKNKTIFLFLICLTFIMNGCSNESDNSQIKKEQQSCNIIKVWTSLYPLEHFAKWIISNAEIHSLIPAQSDPHNFEPSLKDIQELYNSNMVIYLGDTDVDRWLDRIKNELMKKGVIVIRLQDYIPMKNYLSANEIDPHVWLDPLLTLEIIKTIKNVAVHSFPDKKDIYEQNFLKYEAKLRELDNDFKQALSNCSLRDVIVTHEFLNYFSVRYGLNTRFIVHEPEEEVSIKKIKQLKDLMKQNSIKYVISEVEGQKTARALAEETNALILNFNTFHIKTSQDYFHTMRENLRVLKTALNCK